MKTIITISLIFITVISFAQTKAELIDAIKKMNILENDDKGLRIIYDDDNSTEEKIILPSKTDNYENFKALAKQISHEELINLTTDENPVIRMFAIRELFQKRDNQYNFKEAFIKELSENTRIRNHEGCEIWQERTFSIMFNDFSYNWNSTSFLKQTQEFNFVDSILTQIDLFCMYTDRYLPEHFYETIFSRRKYSLVNNQRITELLYLQTNFYAFKYLKLKYPDEFKLIETNFINNKLLKENFDIEKYPNSFYEFLKYAKQNSNQQLLDYLLTQYKSLKNIDNYKWIMNKYETWNKTGFD